MRQHQAQIDRGEIGLVDPYAVHKARPLTEHIAAYIGELRAKGRDDMYCDNNNRFLTRMATECGWNKIGDVTPDSMVKWRDHLDRSAKTRNIYLATAKTFCNWMMQRDRIAVNPLANVGAVEQRGKETRIRRALSDDEIIRLLEIAGKYRIVYLMALTTGLRRGELTALTWGDVHLHSARPFINVRASISKNHKTATMFLRHDVTDALRKIVGADTDPVLNMPGRKRFKSHLKAAGIKEVDNAGRVVDFHSLRHTFITGLSKAGVNPRVAMELARHSQIDLTMRVYTDAGMLGTADAVNALPSWTKPIVQDQVSKATGTDDFGVAPEKPQSGTKTGSRSVHKIPRDARNMEFIDREQSRMDKGENTTLSTVSPDNRGDRTPIELFVDAAAAMGLAGFAECLIVSRFKWVRADVQIGSNWS